MRFIQHFILVHSVYKYAGRFPFVPTFQEALSLVRRNCIKSEVIGKWLYCFATELVGVQLLAIGFWYSYKHGAYVYSGSPKQDVAGYESLDEIRARLGSKTVK